MRCIVILLLSFFGVHSQAQHTVQLTVLVPAGTPANDTLFVAGSFNGWNPHDLQYVLKKTDANKYSTQLQLPAGVHEFKITRGSWLQVQADADGGDVANNRVVVPDAGAATIKVHGWADAFAKSKRKSTASKNVQVLSDSFYMPQLKRYRKIWIYLPEGYAQSRKRYPVLYMHDAQNLFDAVTSFAGEWAVDETLDSLGGQMIIVGINNGGNKRVNEYSPYDVKGFGVSEGNQYLDFLLQTLRPHINKTFRTKRKSSDNYIAGSSMGGLISMYAVLRDPKQWGGAGVFSPAFWVNKQDLLVLAKKNADRFKGKIYLHAGNEEGPQMVPDMLKYFEVLRSQKKITLETVIRAEGKHNEAAWRQEFPNFIQFLLR